MKKTFKLIAALLIATAGYAQAQEPGEDWTLQQCIDYAIKNNIQVKQSQLDVARSSNFKKQAVAGFFPTLNASSNYSYSVGRSINQFNNQVEEVPITNHSTGLFSELVLFNGHRNWNTLRQANIDKTAAELDVAATKNNVALDVVAAYTQILFNRELLENAQNQYATTSLRVERTKTLVEVGSLAMTDLLDLQANLATDELDVVNAENQLDLAHLNLKQILQLPESQSIEIVVPDLDAPVDALPAQSASEIYNVALGTQPQIQAAEARIRFQDYEVRIAKSRSYPSLTLSGGINTNYSSVAPDQIPRAGGETQQIVPIVGFLNQDQNQPVFATRPQNVPIEFTENTYWNQLNTNQRRFVSLNLNIPIFNGYQVRTSIANAAIARENANYLAINQRNILRQTIEQAYLDVLSATKSFEASQNQVSALQESFRSNEQRFELGAINAVDYSLTKNNLNIAESDFIRAKYDLIFKSKLLDFYLGNPLSF